MITLSLIFLLVLAMHAYSEAHGDSMDIDLDIPINHGRALVKRLFTAGFIAVIAMAIDAMVHGWWHAATFIPMGWAWWTILFRLFLNWMRELEYWYISDSNAYDRFWLRLLEHVKYSAELAYAFEGAILGGSLITYFITA